MAPSRLLKVLALFSAAISTNAQDQTPSPAPATSAPTPPTWGGCSDPDLNPLVVIGEKTTICLVIANQLNWDNQQVTYVRLSFQPIADEFSRFLVPYSYKDLVKQRPSRINNSFSEKISIHASSQKAVSFQKLYYDGEEDGGKIYPQLTAIIDVEEGIVKGITWDDGCIFCKDLQCGKNTYTFKGTEAALDTPTGGCGKPESECADGESSTVCDIAFHVVWTGTDGEGRPFQSSAYRFSAFPKQDFVDSLNLPTSFSDLGINVNIPGTR